MCMWANRASTAVSLEAHNEAHGLSTGLQLRTLSVRLGLGSPALRV